MALVLTSGPSVEPITLDEAKSFLRVDGNDEDTLISSLITAARIHVEVSLSQGLITQSWSYLVDSWPATRELTLTMKPIQSIAEIVTYNQNDVATTYAADNYDVDILSDRARIFIKNASVPPAPGRYANGIEIKMVVGYGSLASDVPEPIRQALRLLVTHWFENREPVMFGQSALQVPNSIESLLSPYSQARLA